MYIAERITTCREKRGLSREGLAERLNVTVKEITAWETGEKEPGLEALAAISDFLGVSVDTLVKGRSSRSASQPCRQKPDARIFMAVSAACNILGFLMSYLFGRTTTIIFGLAGVGIYAAGMIFCSPESKRSVNRRVWLMILWFAAYWPLSLVLAAMSGGAQTLVYGAPHWTGLLTIIITVVCSLVLFYFLLKNVIRESK